MSEYFCTNIQERISLNVTIKNMDIMSIFIEIKGLRMLMLAAGFCVINFIDTLGFVAGVRRQTKFSVRSI
jgi:xanthine/uracil/vitamin C permease (AzgA family)